MTEIPAPEVRVTRYEVPSPSGREDDWLATHRFDLDTALNLAKEAAPKLTTNGFTVADALRFREARAAKSGGGDA